MKSLSGMSRVFTFSSPRARPLMTALVLIFDIVRTNCMDDWVCAYLKEMLLFEFHSDGRDLVFSADDSTRMC